MMRADYYAVCSGKMLRVVRVWGFDLDRPEVAFMREVWSGLEVAAALEIWNGYVEARESNARGRSGVRIQQAPEAARTRWPSGWFRAEAR